jgi:aryl-alcohol dehydrogenase-like predicted oxidoreductase
VPLDVGLAAVERLRSLVPREATMAQIALRWILMFEGVTCAIPGARTAQQARDNAMAVNLPPLGAPVIEAVLAVYDEMIRPHVHTSW